MHYRYTDPATGIEVTAEQTPDNTFTLTLWVSDYDGTDDEQALIMQTRAAGEAIVALNTMDRVGPGVVGTAQETLHAPE